MTVLNTPRKAGPFTNSTAVPIVGPFAFTFKIFELTDVKIVRTLTPDESGLTETLVYGTDYTVTADLSAQDTTPGGSITLTGNPGTSTGSLLLPGYYLTILSNVDYSQLEMLTNYDRFMPGTLNEVHDRAVALIQQIKENLDRSLVVSATSSKTPEEMIEELTEGASRASAAATQAEAAKLIAVDSAAEAKVWAVGDPAEPIGEHSSKWYAQHVALVAKGAYDATVTYAKNDWVTNTDTVATTAYVSLVNGNVGNALTDTTKWLPMYSVTAGSPASCYESIWTTAAAIPSGSTVTIPGLSYTVGLKQLIVVIDGVVFYRGRHFNELGSTGTTSNQFVILADIPAGSEIMCWIPGAGSGGGGGALEPRVTALETALTHLESVVAYITSTP